MSQFPRRESSLRNQCFLSLLLSPSVFPSPHGVRRVIGQPNATECNFCSVALFGARQHAQCTFSLPFSLERPDPWSMYPGDLGKSTDPYGKSRSSATLPACHRRQALNLISDEPSAASPPIWQNLHKEMATARQADVWCGIWIERNGAFSQMCRGVTWAPGIGGAQLACRWINLSTPSTPQGRFSGVLAQNNPPFWFNPDAQS